MKGKVCNVVQDLLPSFIDGLTNKETNQFIEEHISSCDECKKIFENMKSGANENAKSKDKKAVNYFKKFRNKLRTLRMIILIIFVIFIVVTVRKIIIISNLENISKEVSNINNYYIELHSLQGEAVNISKSYNKEDKHLTTIETYGININEKRGITIYKDKDGQIGIIQTGEIKNATINGSMLGGQLNIHTYSLYEMGLLQKLLYAVISNVSTDNLNGRECYFVSTADNWKLWIDKENGLIIREINSNMITDYMYKFNTVTDEDLKKPDISDCNIIEN